METICFTIYNSYKNYSNFFVYGKYLEESSTQINKLNFCLNSAPLSLRDGAEIQPSWVVRLFSILIYSINSNSCIPTQTDTLLDAEGDIKGERGLILFENFGIDDILT